MRWPMRHSCDQAFSHVWNKRLEYVTSAPIWFKSWFPSAYNKWDKKLIIAKRGLSPQIMKIELVSISATESSFLHSLINKLADHKRDMVWFLRIEFFVFK